MLAQWLGEESSRNWAETVGAGNLERDIIEEPTLVLRSIAREIASLVTTFMSSVMDQIFVNIPSSIQAPPQTPLPLLSQPNPSWNALLDHDEYDDDLADLPSSAAKKDKQIRRRSSKACDQCRKSKCKCERAGSQDEPCKNCVLLGTPCTFLGPSRKRGPPKGYIDAIESRLHQMEALLGTLLSSNDKRARSLIEDLAGDPLAREILQRVDESPFGSRGKPDAPEDRASRIVRTAAPRPGDALPFSSPSNEWQDHLKERLKAGQHQPKLTLVTDVRRDSLGSTGSLIERDAGGESPRQRRRLDSSSPQMQLQTSHSSSASSSEGEEELASAVGQLSLNEDEQVRYHGKVSGLHILGQSDRLDKRNEGGIWRFPKAGVWPRASHSEYGTRMGVEWEARQRLPGTDVQEDLLTLYFAYVHPVLPVMQEAQFWRDFRGEPDVDNKASPSSDSLSSPLSENTNRVPLILLLSMFATAARYRPTADPPLPSTEEDMWGAGDEYLEHAKRILNQTYASSRPSTCQALLILSYREVGIGAMAQAWLYVGMAVRMAQDLGMHRSAEKWQRTGAELFSETERQVRKRIWYSCVIMDKYVSTYIGRPLSIFERDFDTPFPAEDPAEEMALWRRHGSACPGDTTLEVDQPSGYIPVPTRLISCFTASARLSSILSNIVEAIYAVHPPPDHSRHTESSLLDKRLDKWYIDLPEHLQLVCASKTVPPPHVLTLHMQYWCSVLLVHRPFMRRKSHLNLNGQSLQENEAEAEANVSASCRKAFDLCAMAATRISNIVVKYKENFCLQRSPAFLTYYVFSAGIMHMTTLSVRPIDIQAGLGLQRCMDALQKMNTVWPSAGRAWELLHGAKIDMRIDMREVELSRRAQRNNQHQHDKRKRTPDDSEQPVPSADDTRMQPPSPSSALQFESGVPNNMGVGPLQGFEYSLGLDTDTAANGFQAFDRWSGQDGFSFSPGGGLSQFVDGSVGFDSPKTMDLWKDFPAEQFNDPSLLTSSLYGLPVLSGPMTMTAMSGVQGQPPAFMGADFALYNNVPPSSGTNSQ